MYPRIEFLVEKKLIGMRQEMSFAENTTPELWCQFMPRKKEISGVKSNELFSLQNYPTGYSFRDFDINKKFEKWAAVEVEDLNSVPQDMESMVLKSGCYAVFLYKGKPGDAAPFFTNIFRDWLPNSAYELDDRSHFEILGERFNKDDSNSEEEVWIPVRLKK